MLRSVLAVAVVAATGSAASAGVYLGLGIGTALDESSSQTMPVQGNGRGGKLIGGYRFGRLSVEAAASRAGVFVDQYTYPGSSTQLSAALKYSYPLGDNFEVFGRGGIEHTWLNLDDAVHSADNADGTGWLLGAGVEYRVSAVLAGGSIFVDYEHVDTSFSNNEMAKFGTSSGVFMAGVTLSL
jgi:opacity protein-like surface antigen